MGKPIINPDGINTGNPLEKTSCPIYIELLRKYYTIDKLSTADIAKKLSLSDIDTRIIRPCVVLGWLVKAGITRRSISEIMKVEATKPSRRAKQSEIAKKHLTKMTSGSGNQAFREVAKTQWRKALDRRIEICKSKRKWFTCTLPGCDKRFQRKNSKAIGSKNLFCCRSHATTYYNLERAKDRRILSPDDLAFLAEIESIKAKRLQAEQESED